MATTFVLLMGATAGAQDLSSATVGGIVVTQGAQVESQQLAFTGSSNSTPSMVLIGLAAVAVGLVLFVATRRRQTVLDRA
jgi:LPXTG-motif cell wall-anchored protein